MLSAINNSMSSISSFWGYGNANPNPIQEKSELQKPVGEGFFDVDHVEVDYQDTFKLQDTVGEDFVQVTHEDALKGLEAYTQDVDYNFCAKIDAENYKEAQKQFDQLKEKYSSSGHIQSWAEFRTFCTDWLNLIEKLYPAKLINKIQDTPKEYAWENTFAITVANFVKNLPNDKIRGNFLAAIDPVNAQFMRTAVRIGGWDLALQGRMMEIMDMGDASKAVALSDLLSNMAKITEQINAFVSEDQSSESITSLELVSYKRLPLSAQVGFFA